MVVELEVLGYVERRGDGNDRRMRPVASTRKGSAVVARGRASARCRNAGVKPPSIRAEVRADRSFELFLLGLTRPMHVLTAIYDFAPSLPWWLYRQTQARFHGLVMALFRRHLGRG